MRFDSVIRGGLFARHILAEGVQETPLWRAFGDGDARALKERIEGLFAAFKAVRDPDEAQTEDRLIWPVLRSLGWENVWRQPNLSAKGREDVPDGLLFADAEAENRAKPLRDWRRFEMGLCLVEAKRWDKLLDRAPKGRESDLVPSTQMLRYLRRADDVTQGGLRWGLLTNGRLWRLYWQGALSVSEDFFEIDLAAALSVPGAQTAFDLDPMTEAIDPEHAFRLFALLFSRTAFLKENGRSLHDHILAEGKTWEERVARDLSTVVFEEVFPNLAEALACADPNADPERGDIYLEDVRKATLVLLYRLLVVLYAEDRGLLPINDRTYDKYSLRKARREIASDKELKQVFSQTSTTLWSRLSGVFSAISRGDNDLGVPIYNGGLFSPEAAPLLTRISLSDRMMADVIFRLSHLADPDSGRPARYVNYRDLSVQQLGSVYERILEHGLRKRPDGRIEVAADARARRGSGSYYTSEDLVTLVIERTVGPLVSERMDAFRDKADALKSERGPKAKRLQTLAALDPASRLLDLKICDPAMGSGHFLVSLVDWLADRTLAAMVEAKACVGWGEYISPLAARIADVRKKILENAKVHGWRVVESQLDDRHIVQRMALKRVVYGVDKNPMAVELAKVALWLHSFTVGAPLSFLDHHLRCGDSLFGEKVRPVMDRMREGGLFVNDLLQTAQAAAKAMAAVEDITDVDVAEVAQSYAAFAEVERRTAPLNELMSLIHAFDWIAADDKVGKAAVKRLMMGDFGDPAALLRGKRKLPALSSEEEKLLAGSKPRSKAAKAKVENLQMLERARALLKEARAMLAHERFLHWQVTFPGVWTKWESEAPEGGFDVVVGNPPYVRQELLGAMKPLLKANYEVFDGMADLYVYFYERGLGLLKPGGRLGYVVTNKWFKAGYAEALREMFSEKTWVEFVADFGHTKHFFPDADVFPSVLVVRKPNAGEPPVETQVCVMPRDSVPQKGLSAAVEAAQYRMPRAAFTKGRWIMEPPDVMALLEKIKYNSIPLAEVVGGQPFCGLKTGLNEAFIIDGEVKDRLVQEDPKAAAIIKPYLRGQDIERWFSSDAERFMIVMKSSGDYPWPWANDGEKAEEKFLKYYPSLYRHFKKHKLNMIDREDQGRYWWELRSCAYYDLFEKPKIIYQEIGWRQTFQIDDKNNFTTTTGYILTNADPSLLAVLNAPIFWWRSWRKAVHGKDEALRLMKDFIIDVPVPTRLMPPDETEGLVREAALMTQRILENRSQMLKWLSFEFGLDKPGKTLSEPHRLDANAFVVAVRAALPKQRKLTSSDGVRLEREYAETIKPARLACERLLHLERRLSDLVNAAYGLTPEDVELMWRTAPPRMPLDPKQELERLKGES